MKAVLLLFFIAIAATASAQLPDAELQKKFEKNSRLLQQTDLHKFNLPLALVTPVSTGIYQLRQDNMPCVVPDTKAIVAIPNALPHLTVPAIAAIPNPLLKAELQNGPDSK